MVQLDRVALDPDLQAAGAWHDYRGTGWRVRIRHSASPEVRRRLRELEIDPADFAEWATSPIGDLSADQRSRLCDGISHALISGWENLQDADGSEIEWSEAKAVELLGREDLRQWLLWVLERSFASGAYSRAAAAEDRGKPSAGSSGTSSSPPSGGS